ncbi:hypothetical protein VDGL01_10084 [Verticillium dahliae]
MHRNDNSQTRLSSSIDMTRLHSNMTFGVHQTPSSSAPMLGSGVQPNLTPQNLYQSGFDYGANVAGSDLDWGNFGSQVFSDQFNAQNQGLAIFQNQQDQWMNTGQLDHRDCMSYPGSAALDQDTQSSYAPSMAWSAAGTSSHPTSETSFNSLQTQSATSEYNPNISSISQPMTMDYSHAVYNHSHHQSFPFGGSFASAHTGFNSQSDVGFNETPDTPKAPCYSMNQHPGTVSSQNIEHIGTFGPSRERTYSAPGPGSYS